GVEAASSRLADARRLLDQAVSRAYIAVLIAEANVQILGDSAAAFRREAEIAGARQQAGDISQADRSQIEIAAGRLELDAAAARTAAAAARIAVEGLLVSQNPKGDWVPGDSLEMLATTPPRAMGGSPGAFRPDLAAA